MFEELTRLLQRRRPFVLYGTSALMLAMMIWPATILWSAGQTYRRAPRRIVSVAPNTIAWKQPILPAQFEQANCGACHQADLPQTPRLNHGRQLIAKYNCIGCHTLQDIGQPAMLGPDLTNIGTKVSREWIYKWLNEPRTLTNAAGDVTVDGVVTASRMPKFSLSQDELAALSAYLSVQRRVSVQPYRISARAIAEVNKRGDPADQGQIRFNQRFCITCHSLAVTRGGETTIIGGDVGPELSKVGSKVKSEWLDRLASRSRTVPRTYEDAPIRVVGRRPVPGNAVHHHPPHGSRPAQRCSCAWYTDRSGDRRGEEAFLGEGLCSMPFDSRYGCSTELRA